MIRAGSVSAALIIGCVIAAACGGDKSGTGDSGAAAGSVSAGGAGVTITQPAEGDTIQGSALRVVMSVSGAKLVPAATGGRTPGEGHLHLFVDKELTRLDVPIPMDPQIVHMGDAASEFSLQTLTPGPHRIIAVFAFSDHTPDVSVRTDTVNIIVK